MEDQILIFKGAILLLSVEETVLIIGEDVYRLPGWTIQKPKLRDAVVSVYNDAQE
jgi:hypothetical protein